MSSDVFDLLNPDALAERDGVHRFDYDSESLEGLTHGIIRAVESVTGIPHDELNPTLYEVVEPDSLNSLFEPTARASARSGVTAFELAECVVIVYSDGQILVDTSRFIDDDPLPSSRAI